MTKPAKPGTANDPSAWIAQGREERPARKTKAKPSSPRETSKAKPARKGKG